MYLDQRFIVGYARTEGLSHFLEPTWCRSIARPVKSRGAMPFAAPRARLKTVSSTAPPHPLYLTSPSAHVNRLPPSPLQDSNY